MVVVYWEGLLSLFDPNDLDIIFKVTWLENMFLSVDVPYVSYTLSVKQRPCYINTCSTKSYVRKFPVFYLNEVVCVEF